MIGRVLRTPEGLRALRHGLWIGAVAALLIGVSNIVGTGVGFDAHAYWSAWRHHGLYTTPPQHVDAYLYSPAFAQAVWPLATLPWPVFCALWIGVVAAIYSWLLAPLAPEWRTPLLLLCSLDIVAGNVWAFFALVLVFGFRYPALWAFPLLTKVTPIVGPVWFLARREWTQFALAAAATILIVALSYVAAPGLWGDWVHFLAHSGQVARTGAADMRPRFHPSTPLFVAVAMPVAVATTVFAGRRERSWLLPIAMIFAMPFFSTNAFVVLAAIPRIRERAINGRNNAAPG